MAFGRSVERPSAFDHLVSLPLTAQDSRSQLLLEWVLQDPCERKGQLDECGAGEHRIVAVALV